MKESIKQNIFVGIVTIMLVSFIFVVLHFVGGVINPNRDKTYIERCDGDIEKMSSAISHRVDRFDPEIGGKRNSFFAIGASGDIYYVEVKTKPGTTRHDHGSALGVEFSRDEAVDIIMGDFASNHTAMPNRENYLFVKKAMDNLSNPLLESYFYRRYNIPLSIVEEDDDRNRLIKLLTDLVRRNSLQREQAWRRNNL